MTVKEVDLAFFIGFIQKRDVRRYDEHEILPICTAQFPKIRGKVSTSKI